MIYLVIAFWALIFGQFGFSDMVRDLFALPIVIHNRGRLNPAVAAVLLRVYVVHGITLALFFVFCLSLFLTQLQVPGGAHNPATSGSTPYAATHWGYSSTG